ncbi:MAG: hypothetical protein WC559_06520 [Candidatus Omnitrophota bacterium]
MARVLYGLAMLFFALLVITAFFQPWVEIESFQGGTIQIGSIQIANIPKIEIGNQQLLNRSISGYDVPVLANGRDARLVISIVKIFKPDVRDIDKKSYLVWAIPALAAAIFLLSIVLSQNKLANIIIGLAGVMIFALAWYKLSSVSLDKVVIAVRFGHGIWMTLWGYLGMGLSSILNLFYLIIKKRAVAGRK